MWFKHLLEELAVVDTQGLLDINIHLTSFPNSKDVRMVLLHLAQTNVAEVEGNINEVSQFAAGRVADRQSSFV